MFYATFRLLFPIFLSVAGGFFLTRRFSLSVDTLVRMVTDFFMPFLVFHSLAVSKMDGKTVLTLAGITSFILFILFILSFVYVKITKQDSRSFIPPVIFMNSGFLGIPLMKLWGGPAAMNMIVVYDQIQTTYIFTLGILLVTGGLSKHGFLEMVKSPLLWAIIGGFIWNFLGLPFPSFVEEGFRFVGAAATALATFALGGALHGKKVKFSVHLISAVLLRFFGGLGAGFLAVTLFNITGTLRTVIIAASSLPSAVFSFVLPERYGVDAEFSGAAVLISTVLGVATIPFFLWIAGL